MNTVTYLGLLALGHITLYFVCFIVIRQDDVSHCCKSLIVGLFCQTCLILYHL